MDSDALIKVAMWGKKAGKSTTLKARRREKLLQPGPSKQCATFSLTYKQVRIVFDPVCDALREQGIPFLIDHSKSNPPYVRLRNLAGNIVDYYGVSVEDQKSLVGFKYQDADIDEAGLIPNETYYGYIAPNVTDTMITGTPTDSQHWFALLYEEGQRDKTGRVFSLNIEQQANTRMPGYSADGNHTGDYADLLAKAETLRKNFPEIHRTDVLGLPSESGYRYFREMETVWSKELAEKWDRESGIIEKPVDGEYYSAGWDLGRLRNATVGTVFNRKLRCVYLKILDKQDWDTQEKEINWQIENYPGTVQIDATGMGSQLTERMANRHGECVNGIVFSQKGITRANMRDEILANLNFTIVDARQNKDYGMRLPDIPELREDFAAIVIQRSQAGQETIGDASGHLRDTVSSCALGLWGLKDFAPEKHESKEMQWNPVAAKPDEYDKISGMPCWKDVQVMEDSYAR